MFHVATKDQISFDLLLISFIFYILNFLEKRAENSGVLPNCLVETSMNSSNFSQSCTVLVLSIFPNN